jgi:vancomycin resistance protein YoaR
MIIPAVLLLSVGLIAGPAPRSDEVEDGVRVGGHEVSSTGWEQASADLQTQLDAYLDEPITLTLGDQQVQVSPREFGLSFDLDATYAELYQVGRGGLVESTRERFTAHTSGIDVTPVVTYDADVFMATLSVLADGVVTPPVDASFAWNGSSIVIEPETNGIGVNSAEGARRLQDAVANFGREPIEIPTVSVSPDLKSADLERLLPEVERLAGTPITLQDSGVSWQIGSEELLSLVRIEGEAVSLDMTAIEAQIGTLSEPIRQVAGNAEIIRNPDGTFDIQPETIDRRLDVGASVALLEAALDDDEHAITLVVKEQQPAITADDLIELRREATSIVTRGMALRWPEGEVWIDQAAYANALIFDIQNQKLGFDEAALAQAIQPLLAPISRPPTGLRWKGGTLVTSEDSQPGRSADLPATVKAVVETALAARNVIDVPITNSEDPAQAAQSIQIRDKLGSAATYYGSSSVNRKTNIEVAAAALDGWLIAPRSEFSFNDAIGGTASLEDGYEMGFGIITGANGLPQTVPSVAGGICQVATTVFQSAFWAGLPITNRNWHLYWIPNYGSGPGGLTGLDATVDPDYDLDFNFSNLTDGWLAVSAHADGEWLTIEIWGVGQGWDVQVDEPKVYNTVTTDYETVHRQEDPSVAPGSEVWVETARDGFSVDIHRVVRDSAGNVIEDRVFTSYYMPARNVVLVAPGYGGQSTPQETAPDPDPPVEQETVEEPAAEIPVPVETPVEEPLPGEEPVEDGVVEEVPTEEPEAPVAETPVAES